MSGQNKCGNYVLVENRFWHVDFCNECEECANRDRFQVGDNSFTEQDSDFFEGIDFNLSEIEEPNEISFDEQLEPSFQQEWIDIDDNIDFDEIFNDVEFFCNNN